MRARGAVVVAVATALLGVPLASAAADPPDATTAPDQRETPPPISGAERAAALAEPAIVMIDVRWQGYVVDRATHERFDDEPVTVTTRCTGAGIGGDGYLITTASCVRHSTVATDAFRQVVQRRVADGRTPASEADDLLALLANDAVLGSGPDDPDPPERTITVTRAVTEDEPMAAAVVAVADPADGDAALLRIDRAHQPILALAEEINLDDEVVIVESPAPDDQQPGTPAPKTSPPAEPGAPVFRAGVVSEVQPRLLVAPADDENPAPALPGGVVLTQDADLVGLVDVSMPERDVVVGAEVIRDLLEQAEVDNEPGQVDRDFRDGLDAYYEGRYTEAIERFDAVLAIIPSHVQAHEYREEAQQRREERGGEPAAPVDDVINRVDHWINGREGSLVGLAVLAAIVFFLVRRRHPHLDLTPTPAPEPVPEDTPAELRAPAQPDSAKRID